jgi:hypothetical protein
MNRRQLLSLVGSAGLATLPLGAASASSGQFDFFNRRIPDEVHTLMGQVAHRTITTLAFAPDGGWVLVTQDGGLFSHDIPPECEQKLRQWLRLGYRINCVAFPPAGGNSWAIAADRDVYARNIPEECWQRIRLFRDTGGTILQIAFPPKGGNSWFVLSDSYFYSRNCGTDFYEQAEQYYSEGRKIRQAAFPWRGGWVVAAENGFAASGIDPECHKKMRELTSKGWQLNNVAFLAGSNGWSLYCRARLTDRSTSTPTSESREGLNSTTASGAPSGGPLGGTFPAAGPSKESWTSIEGVTALGGILTAAGTVLGALATAAGTIWAIRKARRRSESPASGSE